MTFTTAADGMFRPDQSIILTLILTRNLDQSIDTSSVPHLQNGTKVRSWRIK